MCWILISGSVVWLVCLLICVLFCVVLLCLAFHVGAQSTVIVLRSCVLSHRLLLIVLFYVFWIPMFNAWHLSGHTVVWFCVLPSVVCVMLLSCFDAECYLLRHDARSSWIVPLLSCRCYRMSCWWNVCLITSSVGDGRQLFLVHVGLVHGLFLHCVFGRAIMACYSAAWVLVMLYESPRR